jgi:hypothetical protein
MHVLYQDNDKYTIYIYKFDSFGVDTLNYSAVFSASWGILSF